MPLRVYYMHRNSLWYDYWRHLSAYDPYLNSCAQDIGEDPFNYVELLNSYTVCSFVKSFGWQWWSLWIVDPWLILSPPDTWGPVCVGIRSLGRWLMHYNLLLNHICNDSLLRLWRTSNVIRRGPWLREFRRGKWKSLESLLSASAGVIDSMTPVHSLLYCSGRIGNL
jgi:hypothetical protein